MKFKDLLNEVFENQKIDGGSAVEKVREYAKFGKVLNNNESINDAAKAVVEAAELAHEHILSETDDWFDAVSVKRNMKQMSGNIKEFKKAVNESSQLNQRLVSLYEEIGMVLNRYYDIEEALDPVGSEDDDIDNDGDSDDSDKYLAAKRKAISKAIKKNDWVIFMGLVYLISGDLANRISI